MDFQDELSFLKEVSKGNLSQESKVDVLYDILNNILDQGAVRARTVKFKLQKYVKSKKINERVPVSHLH